MKNDNAQKKLSLKQFKSKLCEQFTTKTNIVRLTNELVEHTDRVVRSLFIKNQLHHGNQFCLLALGSYGRRELQLHSDVDLLLLHADPLSQQNGELAQSFIQDCWDVGLEISHQITTVKACVDLAAKDLTVISSLLDLRLLAGCADLMEALTYQTHPLHMWSSRDFFFAKIKEQAQRYAKYGETAYNLEPNVKQGSGGLRDLQVILSISKRHFRTQKLADGIGSGFFTEKEYEALLACQHFLWRIRFALHALAQKQEDRLLFDYQSRLAQFFGFQDNEKSLGIEQLMKAYFKVIKRSRELNEMLLQWFAETIIYSHKQKIKRLDSFFHLSNDYIAVNHSQIFIQNPHALLELFLWIAKRPAIKGVRAGTIRLIREHLYLLGSRFLKTKKATAIFLALFKARSPFEALQHMNRYGVLNHYLTPFAEVTGQMQYDLFHVYTVDQHTLFVIRNLERFLRKPYTPQFPLAAELMREVNNRSTLYLAALFHDIAKGRGGDHSELGALDAEQFALSHTIAKPERDLLVWLVRNHLLMSRTAQREDIYDPQTIAHFCSLLPEPHYLKFLYLLTVADICATNQALWNTWKDSLLKELYRAASRYMQPQGIMDEHMLIDLRQKQAMAILLQEHMEKAAVEALWSHFKANYFLQESPEMIATHTRAILQCTHFPLVMMMPHHSQGGTEVFIYMPHCDERFTITTTVLSNYYATIQEASIHTCDNQFDLDTYIILNEHQGTFFDEARKSAILNALKKQLTEKTIPTLSKRRLSQTQAHFKLKPQITFQKDNALRQRSGFFLVAPDRSGLLAHISRVFLSQGVHLHNAKIATAGERAEDMFFISSAEGNVLTKTEKQQLKKALLKSLADFAN
ncbi:MAG: [protein-PII] uridylyltransferase [Tatlockia sp.]